MIKTVKKTTTTTFKTEHMTGVCTTDDSVATDFEKFYAFNQTWDFDQLNEACRLLTEMCEWAVRQRD